MAEFVTVIQLSKEVCNLMVWLVLLQQKTIFSKFNWAEHQEEYPTLLLELTAVEPRHAIGDLEKPKTADVNDYWQHVTCLE